MRALDHLNAVSVADMLKGPTCAAIGIGDEKAVMAVFVLGNGLFDSVSDPFGVVMQDGWQTCQIHVGPAVQPDQGKDFMSQRTTRYNQNTARLMCRGKALCCQAVIIWVLHGNVRNGPDGGRSLMSMS